MPIVAVFEGITREQYEESVRKLTGGDRMASPSDWPVEGLLVHVAGRARARSASSTYWESEEAFQSFGEVLLPILREIGVEGQPEVYAAHTFVSA